MGLLGFLEPSRNNNSSFWGVSLNFERWYLSLSSELYDCLIQGKLYSHFIEMVAFVFLLRGKAVRQCYSWPRSLAGCLVTAQLVHSMAELQKGRALRWGADVWAPGFWHEHYWWCPCWKTSLLPWQIPGEHRGHCQNRGLSVIVNWIFLIMVLSWLEYYSMSFLGMGSFVQLLLIRGLSSTRSHTHKPPLSELWRTTAASWGHLFEEFTVFCGGWRWGVEENGLNFGNFFTFKILCKISFEWTRSPSWARRDIGI